MNKNDKPQIIEAKPQKPQPKKGALTSLFGAGPRDFATGEAIEIFLREERQKWSS